MNPKDRAGARKAPLSPVPATVLLEVGCAMLEGALKYGRHNWREIPVHAGAYYDAAMRHLMAWWEGEDEDPDSGLHHVTKAIATLVVLRDALLRGAVVDDRPPPAPPGWMAELNARAAALAERHRKREAA